MKLQKSYLKKGLLALAVSSALTGCFDDNDDNAVAVGSGGSGGSGALSVDCSNPSDCTTFNFNVNLPPSVVSSLQTASLLDLNNDSMMAKVKSFFVSPAVAADFDDLDPNQFAVAVVNPDGSIAQDENGNDIVFTVDNGLVVEALDGGGYEVSVPGQPQLNCIIVTSLDGPISVPSGTNFEDNNDGFLFAPTTQETLEISLASTSAFTQFLESVTEETFTDAGFDILDTDDLAAVESMVTQAEEVFQDLEDRGLLTFDVAVDATADEIAAAIENALAEIEEEVVTVIQQVVENTQSEVEGSVAELDSDSDSFNWIEAENEDYGEFYIEYGVINTEGETYYEYEIDRETGEGDFQAYPFVEGQGDDDFIYIANADGNGGEWVQSADYLKIIGSDAEAGTLQLQDLAIDSLTYEISTRSVLNLEGRSVRDFLLTTDDFYQLVDESAVFSTGAKAYFIDFYNQQDTYSLLEYDGDAVQVWFTGGSGIIDEEVTVTLESIIQEAPSADPDSSSFTAGGIEENQDLTLYVELVDTGEENGKTAYLYSRTFDNDSESVTTALFELADGENMPSWEYALDNTAAMFTLPESVLDAIDWDADEANVLFAEYDGFIARGEYNPAGEDGDAGEYVYNTQARQDILAAFVDEYTDVFTVSCYSQSEWDDEAFDGQGAPIEPYRLAAFEASADECGVSQQITAAYLAGNTFTAGDESYQYNDDLTDGEGTGVFTDDEGSEFNFTWSINDTANDSIPDGTIIVTLNEGGITYTDHIAPTNTYTADEESDEIVGFDAKIFSTSTAWYVDGGLPEGSGDLWNEQFTLVELVDSPFTASELEGNTFYMTWYNDGSDQNCSTGWIEEELSFSNGNYTLANLCDGADDETNTYSITASGVLALNLPEITEYIQRVGTDSTANADLACWGETEAGSAQCLEGEMDYWFTSEADRTAFISSQETVALPQ